MVLGLTGNMGCGKSTAAAMFVGCGFRRSDSDAIVRDMLLREAEVVSAIRERFGPDVAPADGRVRRDRLAELVFEDEANLHWLEELLHPRLYALWRKQFAEPGAPWIVEVPLLFEKELENWFDFIVCVTADLTQQLRRLEQRGLPPELARQRLVQQLPLAKKCELADFVLLNDGSLDFLREQVNALAGTLNPAV